MMYRRPHPSVVSLLVMLMCRTAAGQVGSARLEGVVRDPSGAIVPGASVTVVNTRTGIEARTSTTPDGIFIIPALQPGFYTLSVGAAGFETQEVKDLELTVGATVVHDVKLEIGKPAETIEVRASTERAQTADAQIAQAVTLRDIDVLPQLARAPLSLGIYSPGIQTMPGTPFVSSSVNGARQGSSNLRLDGIDVNDSGTPYFGWATTGFNTDSVEEFRIVTSGGKAEYGRNAGGQIELITRRGTDTWHGNAFEYLRNTALNANTFFNNRDDLPRPEFIQNRFGASVGGPVLSDRTFIFANYQGLRTAQQLPRVRRVLTQEAKAGVFRWKPPGSSEIQEFDIAGTDPRRIGIDPQVKEVLKLLPDPNDWTLGDGLNTASYRFNNLATQNQQDGYDDQYTFRADQNLWRGHRLFFRWTLRKNWNVDNVGPTDAPFPGTPYGVADAWGWSFSVGSDWTISARLVNELRVGYKFYHLNLDRRARVSGPMLLADPNLFTDPLNPAFSRRREPPVHHITDNLTILRGKHTIKVGAEGRFTNERISQDDGIWPNVYFSPTSATVPSNIGPYDPQYVTISKADRATFELLYNELLGRVSLVTQTFYSDFENFQPAGTPRVRTNRYHEFGAFFQDDWRVHARLVLNLGVRYEFFGVPFEANGMQGVVDQAALINSTSKIDNLTTLEGGHRYDNDWNNFAPRIGLAWDPAGDGKTAVRANWGVFYDRLIGAITNSVDANTPGFSTQVPVYPNREKGADVRISDSAFIWPESVRPAAPNPRPATDRATNLFLFTPDFHTPYVQQCSLTIQREIFRNTVVEAGYVGTRGTKLFMNLNLNQPRIYEGFLPAFRELQDLRSLTPASNTLVRIFGTAANAVTALSSTLDQGEVGRAAYSVDTNYYGKYEQAGVSRFYLRNFPQFNQVIVGTNDGRSYYNSFQLSLRRQSGALKFLVNYTFSKSMDNISVDGAGFTSPIDNFNVRLNRGRSDFDIPHVLNTMLTYTLPVGRDRRFAAAAPRWADSLIGGWDVGLLMLWQSGQTVTYLSGRSTGPTTGSSFAAYNGVRNIGRVMRKADGVYWLAPEEIKRFSVPAPGDIGTGGRNAFRGPRFFNVDMSLVKRFKINDRQGISFRAEAYNLFNNVNFGAPNTNLSTPATFGVISATVGNARVLQMALRYDF